jgi:hypothetical protein
MKTLELTIPCLTAKQLIDALCHCMSKEDRVTLLTEDNSEKVRFIQIKTIERTNTPFEHGTKDRFKIKGHIQWTPPSGWVPFTGTFEGNPWETLKGKIFLRKV